MTRKDTPQNWEEYKKLFSYEKEHATFAKVFDHPTVQTVHALAQKGYFELLEFVISTGKEAHVFRAVDAGGDFRAVKIYKTDTSAFRNMQQYIEGDRRFSRIKHEKHSLVNAWTKKEYKNLEIATRQGVAAPLPLAFRNNVLVMEFIGTNGAAAPTLKDQSPKKPQEFFDSLTDEMEKLYRARLVHADLSEYNILNRNEQPVIIDVGQAVLFDHPRAKEFFERDAQNVARYFQNKGIPIDAKELADTIRKRAGVKKAPTSAKTPRHPLK
ncbi:MAG: serine protein kinase RIO [Candidatus Diapherotrites archaeon]|nr:serine protein kinase RIO [Candidatus Diapherotrites archaeon]